MFSLSVLFNLLTNKTKRALWCPDHNHKPNKSSSKHQHGEALIGRRTEYESKRFPRFQKYTDNEMIVKGYWMTSKTSLDVPPKVLNLSIIGFTRTD